MALIPFPESKIAFVLLLKQTEADSGEDTMPLKIGELWKPSPPTLSSPNNNIQRDSNAWKIYQTCTHVDLSASQSALI